jgi:hypothetical protein
MAAVSLQDPPECAPTVKLEAHKKAILVKLLALDDFSLHGRSLVDGSNL